MLITRNERRHHLLFVIQNGAVNLIKKNRKRGRIFGIVAGN